MSAEQRTVADLEALARDEEPPTADEIAEKAVTNLEAAISEYRGTSPQAALYAALARAQGAFPPIPRNRTVTVQTKTGGKYTFNYAPLDTVLAALRPALAENGLAVVQTFQGDTMTTALLHSGGGMIQSSTLVPRGNSGWQEYGSAQTYARRYALVALLGVASEEDDDGNHAEGNTATATPRGSSGADEEKLAPQHEKDRKACHAIKRKLEQAADASDDPEARAKFDSWYEHLLTEHFGTVHINELDAGQTGQLVRKLRDTEKKIAGET